VNLADLIDFAGALTDYDPTNATYTAQLTSLLNDAQARILGDRPWPFMQFEDDFSVLTDRTYSISVVNGSGTVTGTFPVSPSVVLPGSTLEGATVLFTDSAGVGHTHECVFVQNANTLFFARDYTGVTGTYTASFRWRHVYLPPDTATVTSVTNPYGPAGASSGTSPTPSIPMPTPALSRWERDQAALDPNLLGVPEFYMRAESRHVPAPRSCLGVAVAGGGLGRGVRTLTVYMVNVRDPSAPVAQYYGPGVSAGYESGLSRPLTITLGDTEELALTPETIPNISGLYRRYYFTCEALGIKAPVRLRDAANLTFNRDTVPPPGGVTFSPDTRVSYLSTQTFQTRALRYVPSAGVYLSVLLYPHPTADQPMRIRRLVSPPKMVEDQDTPRIPEAFSQIIAYTALEQLCTKADNLALAQVYARKAQTLYTMMEQQYMGLPPRRIVKGDGAGVYPNLFGPLRFTP
jgi:hypothetical protein